MSTDAISRFPRALPSSTRPGAKRFSVEAGIFAIRGPAPESLQPLVTRVLADGDVTLCRGPVPLSLDPESRSRISPVYALEPGGPPAVPTGGLFVRFTEDVDVRERKSVLARLGYAVSRHNPYARHTAWLRATSGDPAEALAGIARLAALPDVENVEPEMLRPMARRS